jgi:hypothetical protein
VFLSIAVPPAGAARVCGRACRPSGWETGVAFSCAWGTFAAKGGASWTKSLLETAEWRNRLCVSQATGF